MNNFRPLTYRNIGSCTYVKTTPIWAERAIQAGSNETKEVRSHYEAGDYLVSNNEDSIDAYYISAGKFEAMYELAD